VSHLRGEIAFLQWTQYNGHIFEGGLFVSTRGSDWVSFLRVLAILRRLMEGPASSEQLIQSVLQTVGADAYSSASSARKSAFKHDRTHLKNRLGVDFLYLNESNTYILNDAGPYGRVSLSPEMLRALTLLSRQYDNAVGEQAGVRDLVQQIIGWLPPEARTRIEDASEQVSLDFEQDVDRSVIPPRVRETVERALNQHRKLAFNYLSPRREDRQPVYHELAPYQLRFQDGHWYLRGYDLNNALGGEASFLRFRLSYPPGRRASARFADDGGDAPSPAAAFPRPLPAPARYRTRGDQPSLPGDPGHAQGGWQRGSPRRDGRRMGSGAHASFLRGWLHRAGRP